MLTAQLSLDRQATTPRGPCIGPGRMRDRPADLELFRGSATHSCMARQCETRPKWRGLPLIDLQGQTWAPRLPRSLHGFAPAYWVIPSRCSLGRQIARPVRIASALFYRFKRGEEALVVPLALGMRGALRRRQPQEACG